MDQRDVLIELFGRIPDEVRGAVDGLEPELLITPPMPTANTVGWLVWHLTRVQDHHVSHLLEGEQLWVSGNWAPRFDLTAEPNNTGYGHRPQDVVAVRPESAAALIEYYDAVHARTIDYLGSVTAADLDAVIDDRWVPPVTLGVRLVSVADDDIQHAGQAAYARGLLERR